MIQEDLSKEKQLATELNNVREELESLRREKTDLELMLETTTSHATEIENELEEKNTVVSRSLQALQDTQQQLIESEHRANEANRTKSLFLANMSHELRTPMNAILLYSELLQDDASDAGMDDFVTDLKKIQAAGKHLLALINSVLDLSKIESGKMDLYLETFDVNGMIGDVITTIRPLADKNSNKLVIDCPADTGSIKADLTKIRQSLTNLLSNACKFTEHGAITVKALRFTDLGTEWVTLSVSDTGIGLTPEQMGKLFQEFTQADASTTRKYGGTGLGLALSRKFCRMMGGDITVTSDYGHGSTFTIKVPTEVIDPKGKKEEEEA
jgi:signal transduction histidine kinase